MADQSLHIGALASDIWPDRKRHYNRGSILFWQGDPVEQIFIISEGAVKISSISSEGKIYSFGILGADRLLGAQSYLLDGTHGSVAEVVENSEVYVIPLFEFDQALTMNPAFSATVMRELARDASVVAEKARALSFLDVQQRLKHSLMTLAKEHGVRTDKGVIIDLKITQDEIGTLVSANRTTIATCLSELRNQGFLWKEGRRMVIISPEQMEILDSLTRAVVEGDDYGAEEWANQVITQGIDPLKALEAMTSGIKHVDRKYSRDEFDLPDVVLSATAMKQALPIIEANIELERIQEPVVGTVVIGTVFGDIHDIGKTIVAMLLRARNFRVIDLGVNIPADQYLEAVREHQPDILALSALTTATSLEITSVSDALRREKIRDQVKLMVGGGAVTEEYASQIGANGYHITAQGAVETAWRLCTWEESSLISNK